MKEYQIAAPSYKDLGEVSLLAIRLTMSEVVLGRATDLRSCERKILPITLTSTLENANNLGDAPI